MIRRLVELTGCPLSVSLAQSHQRPDRVARAAGPDRGRQRPRACRSGPRWRRGPSGCCSGCSRPSTPSRAIPCFREIAGEPLEAQVARPARPGLPGPAPRGHERRGRPRAPLHRYRPPVPAGRRARLRARPRDERGADGRGPRGRARRLTIDLLTENEGRNFLLRALLQLRRRRPRCLRRDARPPRHALRARATAAPTSGIISDASFPTYALSHWARDRSHGRMAVGSVVERLTSANARAVGLHGPRRPGRGHAGGPQRHRLRPPGLRGAGDGLRPARRRQAVAPALPWLPRHDRRPATSRTATASRPAPCPGGWSAAARAGAQSEGERRRHGHDRAATCSNRRRSGGPATSPSRRHGPCA